MLARSEVGKGGGRGGRGRSEEKKKTRDIGKLPLGYKQAELF